MAKNGTKCDIVILRGGSEHTVDESELSEHGGRCMARCDKRVIGHGDDRKIYCFGCNRTIMKL